MVAFTERHLAQSKKEQFPLRTRIIAAIGAAAAMATLGACSKSVEITVKEDKTVTSASEKTTTTPPPAELGSNLSKEQRDGLGPNEYSRLSEETRATDRAERFNTYLDTAWENIQQYGNLTDEEKRVLYMPDLKKPRSEWTDQDYNNYQTLALWLVTTQSDTNEGLRAATVVNNIDTMPESWEVISQWINQHPGAGLKSVYEAVASPYTNKELHNITVGPVSIDNAGGRFVLQRSLSTPERATAYTLYKNYADTNGNIITVAEGNYTDLSDPALRSIQK